MANYEVVDHTADWALRIWGQDFADLLLHAALGMNSLMIGEEISVSPAATETITRTLTFDTFDSETLLVDWLTELAYFAEMEQLIFPTITLSHVTATHLHAQIQGSPVPKLVKHIKAVTYHNLKIAETTNGLEVTIVFDV
ncbi:MAG: archease [Aquificales bacterium]|nr:archease [Aquificales bacterium]